MHALAEFDRKQWQRWSRPLSRRMARFRPGSLVFRHLALERWTEARNQHHLALRSGSPAAFHRLRIAIKRFRYIVENFLPEQHARLEPRSEEHAGPAGRGARSRCPLAGRGSANVFPDKAARSRWHDRIKEERARRIESYRQIVGMDNDRFTLAGLAQPAP